MSIRAPWYYVALVPEGKNQDVLDLTDRVLDFNFEDHEYKTDKLKLTVNNFDLSNFDDPVWRHGAVLRVAFGNGVGVAPVREMVVRKVTGGQVLTIQANDRAVELDTEKKRRVFENMTRSDIVRQVASEAGFDDPDIEDTAEVFEITNQGNLTDAQFIRKLAKLEGFQFFVDFDGLHWHRRRVGQSPLRTLTFYADNPQAGGDIITFAVENDITRKPGRVRVVSKDPLEQREIVAEASNELDDARDAMQEFIGVIDGETAELTFQKRVSFDQVVSSNAQTQEDAEREAKARYRMASQRAVKMNLTIRGAPDLLAKSVVNIGGLGKRLSGKYYVKEVRHSMGQSGYTCQLKVITDGYGRGFGSGARGAADSDNLLSSCIDALRAARSGLLGSTTLEVQAGQQLDRLIAEVAAVAARSGSQRVLRARSAANSASRLSQVAAQAGMREVSAAAQGCAQALRRIIDIEDARAAGVLNTRGENEQNQRQAVATIDPETQQVVTKFIDKRGRDQ